MNKSIAITSLANRDPSTQVGNSVQQSAGYSFPDQKLPNGSRHEPHIRLLIDAMTIRARSSLWRGSQQPNAVNAQADVQIRTEGSALPVNPSTTGGYRSKPEFSTGHRRQLTRS